MTYHTFANIAAFHPYFKIALLAFLMFRVNVTQMIVTLRIGPETEARLTSAGDSSMLQESVTEDSILCYL